MNDVSVGKVKISFMKVFPQTDINVGKGWGVFKAFPQTLVNFDKSGATFLKGFLQTRVNLGEGWEFSDRSKFGKYMRQFFIAFPQRDMNVGKGYGVF